MWIPNRFPYGILIWLFACHVSHLVSQSKRCLILYFTILVVFVLLGDYLTTEVSHYGVTCDHALSGVLLRTVSSHVRHVVSIVGWVAWAQSELRIVLSLLLVLGLQTSPCLYQLLLGELYHLCILLVNGSLGNLGLLTHGRSHILSRVGNGTTASARGLLLALSGLGRIVHKLLTVLVRLRILVDWWNSILELLIDIDHGVYCAHVGVDHLGVVLIQMHAAIHIGIQGLHLVLSMQLVLLWVHWDRTKAHVSVPCNDAVRILHPLASCLVTIVWYRPLCLLFDWWSHIGVKALSLSWNRSCLDSLTIGAIILRLRALYQSLSHSIGLLIACWLLIGVQIDHMFLELHIGAMSVRHWAKLLLLIILLWSYASLAQIGMHQFANLFLSARRFVSQGNRVELVLDGAHRWTMFDLLYTTAAPGITSSYWLSSSHR